MWPEARRRGRKIKETPVDYSKRAERRRDYYAKIKADPVQFLQIHGLQCVIHIDQNMAATAEQALVEMWESILIDRFDVRAHLESSPPEHEDDQNEEILTKEERYLTYERYRIIAQNSFMKVPEEKFLKQLQLEEQCIDERTKTDVKSGISIGYDYEVNKGISREILEESKNSLSDNEVDVNFLIKVTKFDTGQVNELNKHGCGYGMNTNDFYSFLINDLEEIEALKAAREEQQEKALLAGRKSRRERRIFRENLLSNKPPSHPSYAAKESTLSKIKEGIHSRSGSESSSSVILEKITYITSFGDDDKPSTRGKIKKLMRRNRSCSTSSNSRSHSSKRPIRFRCRRNRSSSTTSGSRDRHKSHRSRHECRSSRTKSFSTSTNSSSDSRSPSRGNSAREKANSRTEALPRYCRRKKNSSAIDRDPKTIRNQGNFRPNSIIERLKKKRQVLINKRIKADKMAEQQKTRRKIIEQQVREDELREMVIKMRKRQREVKQSSDSNTSTDSDLSSKTDDSDKSSRYSRSYERKHRVAHKKSDEERSAIRNIEKELEKRSNMESSVSRRNSREVKS